MYKHVYGKSFYIGFPLLARTIPLSWPGWSMQSIQTYILRNNNSRVHLRRSLQRRKSESKNHIISRGTDLRDITTWTTAPTQPVSFRFARVLRTVQSTLYNAYWQQPIAVPGRIPEFLWLDGPFAVFSSMRVV